MRGILFALSFVILAAAGNAAELSDAEFQAQSAKLLANSYALSDAIAAETAAAAADNASRLDELSNEVSACYREAAIADYQTRYSSGMGAHNGHSELLLAEEIRLAKERTEQESARHIACDSDLRELRLDAVEDLIAAETAKRYRHPTQ